MPKLSPDDVANRAFATSFRGYAEAEVRSFLKRIADELGSVREREHELLAAIDDLENKLAAPRPLNESELLEALGEETTRLLRSAREAADDIRQKSEERASKLIEEAQEESQRLRSEASEILAIKTREAEEAAAELHARAEERVTELRDNAERHYEEQRLRAQTEADALVEAARTQGREMLEEAKAVRERVLADLGRRRGLLQAQLDELRNGRDHLLEAYRTVKRTFLEATEALAQAEARAAAGKPIASVEPSDVEAAIAAETAEAGESAETAETTEAALVTETAGPADAAEGETPETETIAADGETPVETAREEPTGEGAASDAEPVESPAELGDVDSLFARIRASAEQPDESPAAVGAPVVEASDAPEHGFEDAAIAIEAIAVEITDPRDEWRSRAHASIDPLVGPLVKQAKRAAQDEQNALLDALRRHRGRPTAEQVLQSERDMVATWKDTLRSAVDGAYGAGRQAAGGDAVGAPPDLGEESVHYLLDALRGRLANAVDDANDGYSTSLVIERIGARYREWKLQSLEGMVEDILVVAWSRGVFDAAGDGTMLQWVPAEEGRCADCDDNALEQTLKGEHFPTGQPHPPAHPGCRCLLAPSSALVAS